MEEKFIFRAQDAEPNEEKRTPSIPERPTLGVEKLEDETSYFSVETGEEPAEFTREKKTEPKKPVKKGKGSKGAPFTLSGIIALILGLAMIVGSGAAVLRSGSIGTGSTPSSPSNPKPGSSTTENESGTTPAENLVTEQNATVLQKTEDAGEEYIKDTLFIGDSNYNRFYVLGLLSLDNVIGVDGMGIQSVPAAPVVYFVEQANPVSIPTAIKNMQPRRIIMNYGTNNLVSGNVDSFIENYNEAIDALENAFPYADIIVSSIPPVGKNLDPGYSMVDYQKVYTYNSALIKMCESRGIHYLNVTEELLRSADGYCKSEYITGDGIHLEKTALEKVLEYVRCHALLTEDTRPESTVTKMTRKAAPVVVYQYQCDQVVATAMEKFFEEGYVSYKKPKEGEKEENYRDPETYTFKIAKSDAVKGSEEEMGLALFQYVNGKVDNPEKAQITIAYKIDDDGNYVFTATVKEICKHDYETTDYTEATCTHGGSKTMVCRICGKKTVTTIDKLDHEFDWSTAEEYNSSKKTIKVKCKECGEYYEVDHGDEDHEWSDGTVSVEATCTTAGKKTSKCKICGLEKEIEIPALGHDFSVFVSDSATCASAGKKTYKCSRCDQTKTEDSAALGHDFSVFVSDSATCAAPGKKTYKCSRCDETKSEDSPALGHDFSVFVGDSATCTEPGKKTYKCSRCDETTQEDSAALGHNFENGFCTRCGEPDPNYTPPEPDPEPDPEPGSGEGGDSIGHPGMSVLSGFRSSLK